MLSIVAAAMIALLAVLAWIGEPGRWPAPEIPPRQSEAVDVESLRAGRAAHAAAALTCLIREPQNTWSNAAFIVAGAWLIARWQRGLASACGWALVGLGIGSFLYHASASRTLRHLDVAGMYWLFLMLAWMSGAALWPRLRPAFERNASRILAMTLLLAVLLTVGRNLRVFGFKPFALSLATGGAAGAVSVTLGVLVLRARCWRVFWPVLGTLVLFSAALTCQIGDRPGNWLSAPDAPVQAHALWHLLSAAAVVGAVSLLQREPLNSARGEFAGTTTDAGRRRP